MMPYLTEEYGNAGTLYSLGRRAASAIMTARDTTAALLGAACEQIIFTSGGSESNNTVFKGLRHRLLDQGKTHLVVSAIEHDSVLKAAQSLIKDGFDITYVQPDAGGCIHARAVEEAMRPDTGLVSVMFVNNETGVVNDIESIGMICRRSSVLFHSDCVQAAGQYDIDVDKFQLDFASVSSHKIHGPKGVGALYVRDKSLASLICGGAEQEFGLRGGTENVAGIVGFGRACEMAKQNLREDMIQVSALKQLFYSFLLEALKQHGIQRGCVHVNGMPVVSPGKTLNIRVDCVDGETLLLMLDAKGVCVSAGSACRSREAEPSHVLTAMGLSSEEARSSVRISLSKYNTSKDIIEAAGIFASSIAALQQHIISPQD